MAAPFYFLPKLTLSDLVAGDRLKREPLVRFGLEDVLRDVRTNQAVVQEIARNGPSGGAGVLIYAIPTHNRLPGEIRFNAGRQAWLHPTSDDAPWIGVDNEFRPTPEDLERVKVLRGYALPLGDTEHKLHVPILRSPTGATSLPEDFTFDEGGRLQRTVKDAYREIWEDSAEVWDVVISRDPAAEIDISRGVKFSIRVLSLNYRFGLREQSLLRWIDGENWTSILSLCVDLPNAKEQHAQAAAADDTEKKSPRLPGSVKRSPGPPDSAPITDQAEAISG